MKQIVVMPGGFHPFHAGHASLYLSAVQAFPDADVYVAATNDQKTRPFPFAIKEKLAKIAGVAPGRFVQVKSPFQVKEITGNYNPDQDVLIYVRSEKDRTEQPKPGGTKKDGSAAYFQPYTGKDLQPFSKHAYIAYLPTIEFGPGITSASEIRALWPKLNDKRKLAMVMSLYPATQKNSKLANNVKELLDLGMTGDTVDDLSEGENWSKHNKISEYKEKVLDVPKTTNVYYKPRHGNKTYLIGKDVPGQHIDQFINLVKRKYSDLRNADKDEIFWNVEPMREGWSEKYKRSIDCSHPKGFSQKAHCAGKKKHNESVEMEMTCPDCGMCETHAGQMTEAFDKPYQMKWSKKGNRYTATTKLPDKTKLQVVFSMRKRYDGDVVCAIDFYRDGSVGKTEQGDSQRIFATVIVAIQHFLTEIAQPDSIEFSANKASEDESRSNLYTRMVQRFAGKLGYDTQVKDAGFCTIYELNKEKSEEVTELVNPDIRDANFEHKQEIGDYVYTAKTKPANKYEPGTLIIQAWDGKKEIGHAKFVIQDWRSQSIAWLESQSTEVNPEYRSKGVAATMYAYAKMLGNDIHSSEHQNQLGQDMWENWGKDAENLNNTYKVKQEIPPEPVNEACWKGYHKEGNKKMFGKTYPNCVKNTNEELNIEENRENFNGLNLLLQKDEDELFVKASAGSRELGHVLFVIDGDYLIPQDLEVEERYRGQGIAQTMYDFVKSKGYNIRRSGQQTDAGAGFWDKHKPGKNIWEQGVAEEVNPDVTSDEYFMDPTENVRMGDFMFNARTFTGGLGNNNARGLQIRAYDPKNLKRSIGSADFIVKSDKKGNQWLESDDTEVNDEYRGKGVATMMYAFAKSLGNDIKDSPYQSKAGSAMWSKWGSDAEHLAKEGVAEEQHSESCPHCGGELVSEELMNEKKDACYYKVKSRYKVWPSAYASGALVKCRKAGASNWGNGGKKNESSILGAVEQVDENLHQWFKEKWVRFGPDGKIRGDCARGDDSEGKPKCLPQSKAHSLGKKGRASAAARKRREDPNPERHGKAINVNTKKKSNESVVEDNKPAFMEPGNMKPFKVSGKEIPGSVETLEKLLLKAKDRGVKLDYNNIDKMMQLVCREHHLTGDDLHVKFVKKHHMIPDNWIKKQTDVTESVDYLEEK